MFKVNNKNTKVISSISVFEFEQVNVVNWAGTPFHFIYLKKNWIFFQQLQRGIPNHVKHLRCKFCKNYQRFFVKISWVSDRNVALGINWKLVCHRHFCCYYFNPLIVNPTIWSNTLKKFCGVGAYRINSIIFPFNAFFRCFLEFVHTCFTVIKVLIGTNDFSQS